MTSSKRTNTARLGRLRGFARGALDGILTLAAGALTVVAHAQAPEARWQPPQTIAEAARAAAAATTPGDIEATSVDDRLKLARCAVPLDARIERAINRGRGTVVVACAAPTPWRLFVPVRAVNDATALVLVRNVQPGDVLAEADFEVVTRSSTSLPYDYVADAEQAVGQAMRRTQTAGSVLTTSALAAPEVVRRGELVTLIAGDGPVSVKSEGIALEAARLRQRLKVRSASGRVIEGTAEGPGQVRVGT